MATIEAVLRHLVKHSPGLSDENRADFLAAVHEATKAEEPAPAEQPEQKPES